MPGRDLTVEPDGLPGRAMMQYNDHLAWMEGNPRRRHAAGQGARARPLRPAAQASRQRCRRPTMRPRWRNGRSPLAAAGRLYREQRYRLPGYAESKKA